MTAMAEPRPHALLARWPTALGLVAAAAAFLSGADRDGVAITVAVAAVCYLAAAALGRRWTGWAAIPVVTVLVVLGGLLGAEPLASLAVMAVVLVVTGLALRVSRATLTAQAVGVLLYAGLAVVALALAPTVGLVLAAVTLIGHGAWDIWLLRRDAVVPRSLTEACIALDVPLGTAVLVALALT